jgi:REP element-mobilizing transposase RayT
MRKALRLSTFDYTLPGAYFVTICVRNRAPLFGRLTESSAMQLGPAGMMVDGWWRKLPEKFESVELDAHAVMPDHIHGIVMLHCAERFETMTTAEYFRGVAAGRWERVDRRLWQRGFYDHVIRSERELLEIRGYIETKWRLVNRADTWVRPY